MATSTDFYPDGIAAVEAQKHQPEKLPDLGCTCGFAVWFVEHVAIMTSREVLHQYDAHLRRTTTTGSNLTDANPTDAN